MRVLTAAVLSAVSLFTVSACSRPPADEGLVEDLTEAVLPPGGEHELSLHHPTLVYALTPAAVDFRSSTGGERRVGFNQGAVVWLKPEVLIAENSGADVARLAVFSLKWVDRDAAAVGGG